MNIKIIIDYEDSRSPIEIEAKGPESESPSLLHIAYDSAANAMNLEPFWRQYIKKAE